jgi:hypothetical protein
LQQHGPVSCLSFTRDYLRMILSYLPSNSVLVALAIVFFSISFKRTALVRALTVCGILGDDKTVVDQQLEEHDVVSHEPPDNLELMKEIVEKIKEDEVFARSIYADCPRLQALLVKHPDIRPLFENPKFVIINFEKVYHDAIRDQLARHPLFWVFNVIATINKIVLWPIQIVRSIKAYCFSSTFLIDDMFSIHSAADRLADPAVQAQIFEALNDPALLPLFIESNKELRELRDSNPLCAEMMNDPETFRIISIPENLRALGDAPGLIEADFADPDGGQDSGVVDRTVRDVVNVIVVERGEEKQTKLGELNGFVAGFLGALAVSLVSSIALRTNVME